MPDADGGRPVEAEHFMLILLPMGYRGRHDATEACGGFVVMAANIFDAKRWFTLSEAATYSGLSDETIRRLSKAGKLTPNRPTGLRPVLYDREQLDGLKGSDKTPRI
jgi:excisionase family DNA binding protein